MNELPKLTQEQERNWAMFCHLAGLAGSLTFLKIPLLNIVVPLVLWLVKKDQSEFVNDQGKEALNFQISITIYSLCVLPLCLILIGIPILIAIAIFDFVMLIIAAINSHDGKQYRYPLCWRLVK